MANMSNINSGKKPLPIKPTPPPKANTLDKVKSKMDRMLTNAEPEKVFLLTESIWENLLKDETEHDLKKKYITSAFIEKNYNASRTVATCLKYALDNKETIHSDLRQSLRNSKVDTKVKEEEKKNRDNLKEIEKLQNQVNFLLGISNEVNSIKINKIKPTHTKENEAVVFAILSDVHIEEKVDSEVVNGLNEYNPEIAKNRLDNFFVNLLKLVEKERQDVKIDTLVLGLLGDFITGYIHEELKESNYMSPTEATRYVQNLLVDGISYLVDNGNFKKIVIPCTRGNHGRTTAKKRFSTGADNSFEWMMYKNIENDFFRLSKREEKYKMLEFVIPKSELVYIEVFDKVIRFGHGDHFRYGGGIGGLTIPLVKWLKNQNAQKRADMTFIGHWHNILTEVTEDCMINGSIIGINGYSMGFGGIPRPPQQIFALLDKNRGFSVRVHIDVL